MATDLIKALEGAATALERLAADAALTSEQAIDDALEAATAARRAIHDARAEKSA